MKDKCLKLKKSKTDTKKPAEKSKTKEEGTSTTASIAEATSDDDGAWVAEELFGVKKDWFEEVVEVSELAEALTAGDVGVDVDENGSQEKTVEVDVEELGDTLGEAFVVAEFVQTSGRAELYDSGCMNHISPYKSCFENFQTIEP